MTARKKLYAITPLFYGHRSPKKTTKNCTHVFIDYTIRMTVLILTPLALEFDAVVKFLSDRQPPVYFDQAAYEQGTLVGRYHTYTVVVRRTGMKNVDVALCTERAIQHFNPRIALLVGIAAGIKDVRIGDVLIADKAYGYESGKEDADGRFKARPLVEPLSGELLARAEALGRGTAWKRRTHDGAPEARIFIGPIAAGEKVIASVDNPSYQRLKTHFNDTLGLELESIGFATTLRGHRDIHGLIIRGISDLCEGKAEADKGNGRELAAERAAAVAMELLGELDYSTFISPTMDTKMLAREICTLLTTPPERLQEYRNDFAQAKPPEIRQIWEKIKPLVLDEVEELARDAADMAAKGALEMKLRKAVEGDAGLGTTLSALLDKARAQDGAITVVQSKNVIAGSTITVGGDFRVGDNIHVGDGNNRPGTIKKSDK